MKIELNSNYAYDLSELTIDQLRHVYNFFDINRHKEQNLNFNWFLKHYKINNFHKCIDEDGDLTWNFIPGINGKQVINAKKLFEKITQYQIGIDTFNPQPHYNNENGSLYKIANDLGLNHWEFDIFKRLVRCRKKSQFKEDLQKIKDTIDIYLNEYSE